MFDSARKAARDAHSIDVPTFIEELKMSVGTILLIILVLVLIGAFPRWPHSKSWGYGPSGLLGVVVIVLVILLVTGRI